MKSILKYSILGSVAALLAATTANAAPFLDISILGSTTDNGTDWASTVKVTPGETVFYEVTGVLAPAGTTNNSHPYTTATQVSGTDGIGGLQFNLTDADSAVLGSSPTLQGGFGGGTGSGASVTGQTIAVNALLGTGVADVGATAPVTILTGTLTTGASVTDTLSGSLGASGFDAKVAVTGPATHNFVAQSQGTDPYVGFASLTLTQNSISSPVFSLTSSAPTAYGSPLGTLSVSPGGNGSYVPRKVTFAATTSGYVSVSAFSPATDPEIYALDVDGASSTQLQDLLTDITSSGVSGVTDSLSWSGINSGPNPLAGIFTDGGTPLYVSVAPGIAADPFLGFNLSNDSALSGVTISGVAAVPEPVSAGILGLGGLMFLARRRRTNA